VRNRKPDVLKRPAIAIECGVRAALAASGVPDHSLAGEVTPGKRHDPSVIGQSRPGQAARPVARAA